MNTLGDAVPGGDSNLLYTGQQTGPAVGPGGIPPASMSQTWFSTPAAAAANVAPSQSNTMLYVVLGALALLLIVGR